jgi:hypothetical protein
MQERQIRRKWTGSLHPPHTLTDIAFYAGQMDEGTAVEKFVEENDKHYGHGMGRCGQNVFWNFDDDSQSWELGREPHFRDHSHEYFGIFTEMEPQGYTWLQPIEDPEQRPGGARYRMYY